jgi:hypothetical protein
MYSLWQKLTNSSAGLHKFWLLAALAVVVLGLVAGIVLGLGSKKQTVTPTQNIENKQINQVESLVTFDYPSSWGSFEHTPTQEYSAFSFANNRKIEVFLYPRGDAYENNSLLYPDNDALTSYVHARQEGDTCQIFSAPENSLIGECLSVDLPGATASYGYLFRRNELPAGAVAIIRPLTDPQIKRMDLFLPASPEQQDEAVRQIEKMIENISF